LVSIPLWFAYRANRFGWMVAYFGIQALAIIAERRLLRPATAWNRVVLWLVVLVPAPLVLNQGTLLIFHLSYPRS
jgi:hypothetical protein